MPLLDERALGEPSMHEEAPRPRVLDAKARRETLFREAVAGTEWTSRSAAERLGVSQVTAAADLGKLVASERLAIVGRGRARRYVVSPSM
jgi:hypothetical protein